MALPLTWTLLPAFPTATQVAQARQAAADVCVCVCFLFFFLLLPRGHAGGTLEHHVVPKPRIEPVKED